MVEHYVYFLYRDNERFLEIPKIDVKAGNMEENKTDMFRK